MNRLIIISGASRGIGKQIAIETNKKFNENTMFLLIARNHDKLVEVKEELEKQPDFTSNKILILPFNFNNSMPYLSLVELFTHHLKDLILYDLKELYVFYNHGTMKTENIEKSADEAPHEFQTNVFSVWTLLSTVRQMFPLESVPTQFHINISSMLASVPMQNVSIYNTTRAARAMLFKCLAVEHPQLRVLNYQPGPVYTDMLNTYAQTKHELDEFKINYDQGKFLTTEETLKRLMGILSENKFATGSTIDYFDRE